MQATAYMLTSKDILLAFLSILISTLVINSAVKEIPNLRA